MKQLFPSTTGALELFDEFFQSGLEESISPFLFPKSRRWGRGVGLRASIVAAGFLFFSYFFSFFDAKIPLSNFFLLLTFFFAGIPALIHSIEDLLRLEININVLMTLAAFLSILIGSGKEGALLLVLFALSGAMEEAVSLKAKGALSSLKKLSPQKAWVVQQDSSLLQRSVRDIAIGTLIHVKASDIVPLDGIVVEGASSVNLVHLTGENLPVKAIVNDEVPAGARNLEGSLTLRVTRISSDSTLARIIQLIIQAQESKPKLQQFFDKLSSRYAITIISLAALFALSFPFLFSMPFLGKEGSIYRSLAFLIAASPCALIIAVPIAYLSAVSACAKQGILLKGGIILDALAKCTTIALDKTGTVTTGELKCAGIKVFGDFKDTLALAYTLERSAMHPIAYAIVEEAKKQEARFLEISDFAQVPGYGLQAKYLGKEVFIGLKSWILPKIPPNMRVAIEKEIASIQEQGELFTLFVYDSTVAIFEFKDTLRPKIFEVFSELKRKWNMKLIMLSGDHYNSVKAVAAQAGITDYYAELRPEEKLEAISKIDNLVMIGDGINDAPALARADVGISMGKVGSGTAIDASDIVLLQDNIELLAWLINKAHQVVRIVKQNLIVAAAAIVFATMPALLGWIPLWLAVILHEGGTVLVGLNALRLLKGKNVRTSESEIKSGNSS